MYGLIDKNLDFNKTIPKSQDNEKSIKERKRASEHGNNLKWIDKYIRNK